MTSHKRTREEALAASEGDRARARACWPVRVVALGAEEPSDGRDVSTVDERLAMVATLTGEQWAFAGLTVPRYGRSDMPGRIVRT